MTRYIQWLAKNVNLIAEIEERIVSRSFLSHEVDFRTPYKSQILRESRKKKIGCNSILAVNSPLAPTDFWGTRVINLITLSQHNHPGNILSLIHI